MSIYFLINKNQILRKSIKIKKNILKYFNNEL